SAIFSRASAAAWGDRSTAITRSKSPSVASESAMQPHPVPMSATTPPPPPPPPPPAPLRGVQSPPARPLTARLPPPPVLPRRALDEARAARSGTDARLLCGQAQRVDQLVELPVHHLGEVMRGEADAMVGDAVLREVVGADLLRPIARPHLSTPHPRPRRLLVGE